MTTFEAAAPTCHDCERKVLRVEMDWRYDDDICRWWPVATMVCEDGHRVIVEPFE